MNDLLYSILAVVAARIAIICSGKPLYALAALKSGRSTDRVHRVSDGLHYEFHLRFILLFPMRSAWRPSGGVKRAL
jgi:hypothetical protein